MNEQPAFTPAAARAPLSAPPLPCSAVPLLDLGTEMEMRRLRLKRNPQAEAAAHPEPGESKT